jgi:hypothetical protein
VRALLLVLLVAACDKGNNAPTGPGARDTVIDAWKKGGLDASAFATAATPIGKDCAAGTVGKVDVLVCSYTTPDEAKAAQDAGLQWVGDTTGASQARGTLLIAVADRRKADPSGKTINQIFKLAGK